MKHVGEKQQRLTQRTWAEMQQKNATLPLRSWSLFHPTHTQRGREKKNHREFRHFILISSLVHCWGPRTNSNGCWGVASGFKSLRIRLFEILVSWVFVTVDLHVGDMTFFWRCQLVDFNKALKQDKRNGRQAISSTSTEALEWRVIETVYGHGDETISSVSWVILTCCQWIGLDSL